MKIKLLFLLSFSVFVEASQEGIQLVGNNQLGAYTIAASVEEGSDSSAVAPVTSSSDEEGSDSSTVAPVTSSSDEEGSDSSAVAPVTSSSDEEGSDSSTVAPVTSSSDEEGSDSSAVAPVTSSSDEEGSDSSAVAPVTSSSDEEGSDSSTVAPVTSSSDEGSVSDVVKVEEDTEKQIKEAKIKEWLSTQSEVQVYHYDSDRLDCSSPVIEPWDMQKIINEEGINIVSSSKGFDGITYSVKDWGCRNHPPAINIFSILVEDYEKVKKLGLRLCKELEEEGGYCHSVSYSELLYPEDKKFIVHIYKYSESKQCNPGSGIDIKDMAQELIDSKIMVYQSYKALDGLLYSVSCGENTGDINVYVIEKIGLMDSMLKGYRECAWLEAIGGGCYPISD